MSIDPFALRQIQGTADLLRDAVDGAVVGIADAHDELVRRIYALIGICAPLRAPVCLIEHAQRGLTRSIYAAIREGNHIAGQTVSLALRELEAQTAAASDSTPE